MAPRKLGSAQASGQALRNKSQILDRSPPPPPTTTKHRNVRHVCPLTCRSAATRSHRRRQVAQIRNTHCTDRYKVISCRLTRPHNRRVRKLNMPPNVTIPNVTMADRNSTKRGEIHAHLGSCNHRPAGCQCRRLGFGRAKKPRFIQRPKQQFVQGHEQMSRGQLSKRKSGPSSHSTI